MPYVVGVSSGIFSAIPEGERIQFASLAKKAEYCITKGVEFVQIDLESVAEFKTPDIKPEMERIKRMGITFGIHSETKAFGVEVAELDSAIETDYKFGHERLVEILEKSGEIGSKYVLVHSSESEPFLLLERHLQPAFLVDFFGNPFRKFLEDPKNSWLIDWAIGGKSEEINGIQQSIYDSWLAKGKKITSQDIRESLTKKNINPQTFMWIELIGYQIEEALRRRMEDIAEREEIQYGMDYDSMAPEYKDRTNDQVRRNIEIFLKDIRIIILDYVQSRTLHYGPERVAYYFTAKWMETNKDPLWENIVRANVEYFAKDENKTVAEWMNSRGIKNLSIEDENFRKYSYLWVPAVSAKYIWGHLNQDKNPSKLYANLKETIKKYKMPLVLETPMAHRGIEEWLRLPNPIQMYYLAKQVNEEAGFECVALAMDFEHMISIRLEPEKVIDVLPEGAGKFVRVLHLGYPAPLAPAHIPIPFGSEQQLYLYKMMYMLRQKGFGKNNSEFFIIFERGGGADPIQQSVLAIREIVKFLEKDTPWGKLPAEFYGLATGQIASWERQLTTIREHAREPLKGLITTPEEDHTFLGRAAIEKGKRPDEWKKEELK
jgi:hypothetical protein